MNQPMGKQQAEELAAQIHTETQKQVDVVSGSQDPIYKAYGYNDAYVCYVHDVIAGEKVKTLVISTHQWDKMRGHL